jgi:3-hydroxyacyl-[acyl-carrier-protein] dehydratase
MPSTPSTFSTRSSRADILSRVKTIMRRDLKLGPDLPIADDMPFFGGEADIDSLDVLLLLSSVEKEFGIRIPNEAVGRQVFQSVGSLADYLERQIDATAPPAAQGPAASLEEYLRRLPHAEPFRFVSRAVAVREGESAEGVWAVTGAEAFFAGHFPGRPIVPGVLIAEALAQVSGLAIPPPPAGTAMEGKLAQVDVRFEQPVVPPAEIVLRSKLTRRMGTLSLFDVSATVGPAVVARGTLTISTGPAAIGS